MDNLDKSKEEIETLVRKYIDHATNIKMGISEEEKDSLVYNAGNNAEENPEPFNQQS